MRVSFKDPVIAARRKAQPLGGVGQRPEAGSVRFGDLLDETRRRGGVAGDALEAEARIADELDRSRRGDPRGDFRGDFAGAGPSVGGRYGRDVDPRDRSGRSAAPRGAQDTGQRSARSARACRRIPARWRTPQRHGFIAAMSWNRAG